MNEDCFHLGIKALIRNREGKILLLKTNPAELKGYNGEPYWDIPGGRIQRGDSIEECLKREVKEETGITSIKSFKPFLMALSPLRIPVDDTDFGLILSVYLCEVENIENIKLSKEHLSGEWFSPKEASELLEFKYPKEFTEKLSGLK